MQRGVNDVSRGPTHKSKTAKGEDDIFTPGLAGSLYWAIITMTTVGYGDITPKTPAGRVVRGQLQ